MKPYRSGWALPRPPKRPSLLREVAQGLVIGVACGAVASALAPSGAGAAVLTVALAVLAVLAWERL